MKHLKSNVVSEYLCHIFHKFISSIHGYRNNEVYDLDIRQSGKSPEEKSVFIEEDIAYAMIDQSFIHDFQRES